MIQLSQTRRTNSEKRGNMEYRNLSDNDLIVRGEELSEKIERDTTELESRLEQLPEKIRPDADLPLWLKMRVSLDREPIEAIAGEGEYEKNSKNIEELERLRMEIAQTLAHLSGVIMEKVQRGIEVEFEGIL